MSKPFRARYPWSRLLLTAHWVRNGYVSLVGVGLAVLVFSFWVYAPGLHGGFLFDDYANIVENQRLHWQQFGWQQIRQAIGSANSGPLGRPVSLLSFALNYLWAGLDPYWFKLTGLVIHLLNGIGLFFLSRLLFVASGKFSVAQPQQVNWASLFVAAAWLLHPFNLTSVLYIVQRMTELAAFFTIWGMVFYTWGRWRQWRGHNGLVPILLGLVVCAPLAVLSKENGVLIFPLLFIVEWVILRFRCRTSMQKRSLYFLFAITLLLPLAVILFVMMFHQGWLLSGYDRLGFTLEERLLTQARVLIFYMRMILFPDITQMGLFHDDFILSTGLYHPSATWIAGVGLTIITIVGLVVWRRLPLLSFGLLFFLIGHSLESTFIPLELIYEHRNYLPSFGLLFAVLGLLLEPRGMRAVRSIRLRIGVAVLLIGVFALGTTVRARTWSNQLDLAFTTVLHHPQSIRANVVVARAYIALARNELDHREEYYEKARHHYRAAVQARATNPAGYFGLLRLDGIRGKPVDEDLLANLVRLLSTSPVSASSVISLSRLRQCQNERVCGFPSWVFDQLYSAILQNPRILPEYRSRILSEATRQALDSGNLHKAAIFSHEAVVANPTVSQFHLDYADVLFLLGERDAATEQLHLAGQYDSDGFYSAAIEQRKARLKRNNDSSPQDSL